MLYILDLLVSLCYTSHSNLLLPPLRMYRFERQLTTATPAGVAEPFIILNLLTGPAVIISLYNTKTIALPRLYYKLI